MNDVARGVEANAEASGEVSAAVTDISAGVEQPSDEVRALFGEQFDALDHFAQMLVAEGELRGLIGPREVSRLWSRHLVNCAAVLDFIPSDVQVLDVGSGAGFPGLVVAIARPDLDVHLVEPMSRRVDWLIDVRDALTLDNVTVHEARAEELVGRGVADVVTSRAVANLSKLLPLTMPLVARGGKLVALKGRRADEEVKASRSQFSRWDVRRARVHSVVMPMDDEPTRVVVLDKRSR